MSQQSTSAHPPEQDLPPLPEVFDGTAIRHVPGFPGYAITDHGEPWSCLGKGAGRRRGGPFSLTWRRLNPAGRRPRLSLVAGGKKFNRRIHVLVLEAFVGPCPPGLEGCHRDDDPRNNRLDNLRWDTHKGNFEDAVRNGRLEGRRILKGQAHGCSKLTDADIPKVLALFAEWRNKTRVARHFGVSPATVLNIVTGRGWRHVPRD